MSDEKRYAPIFPLPNLNLFPQTSAIYHIFEKRYREMVHSALEGNRLIAMALLKPGYEEHYYGNPEIYPMGCLGEINSYEELEDGKYNIVLKGLERVGFGELVQDYPYRVATLTRLDESDLTADFQLEKEALLQRLDYLAKHSEEEIDFSPLLHKDQSGISLINLIAKTLPISAEEQYGLLAMDRLQERAAKVLWYLDDHIDTMALMEQVDPQSWENLSLN